MTGRAQDCFQLDGQVGVIAGGLGKIGASLCRAIAACGGHSKILDISDSAWPSLQAELDAEAEFINTDLADPAKVPALVTELFERFPNISYWINAAYPRTEQWGVLPEEVDPGTWARNVEMHMNTYCLIAEHVARHMAAARGGSIINVASIFGIVAPDFQVYEGTDIMAPSPYSAIKGGIIAYTRYLASYYGRQGVRVNALCPGGIAAGQSTRFVEQYARRTALGRMADAAEIGPPAVFLVSDASSYITGSTLMVDGGWTAI